MLTTDVGGRGARAAVAGRRSPVAHLTLPAAGALAAQAVTLTLWVRNAFVLVAMLDYPYATSFVGNLPAWPVNVTCDVLLGRRSGAHGGTAHRTGAMAQLARMAQAAGIVYNSTGDLRCFNISAEFYPCADPSGCGGPRTDPGALAWDYQACTELILALGTNNVTDMFVPAPFSSTWLDAYCRQNWDVMPRPDWLWLQYGGKQLDHASRIIFSNGLLDPWRAGGLMQSMGNRLVALKIPMSAHHLDLRGSHAADPLPVKQARVTEAQLLRDWVAAARRERAR